MRFRRAKTQQSHAERALAAAAELVAANKPIEAIQLLTEANQKQRDRAVEHRLVELRFEAFRSLSWPSTPPWPEEVEDLFPGQRIPEIDRDALTVDAVRSAIEHHGSLLVRGLVDRERVERLIADIDTTFDAFDAKAADEQRSELAGWYERFEPDQVSDRKRLRTRGTIAAVDSPPALFDLIDTLDRTGVRRLARDYFGEPPMILARKANLRHLPSHATGGWHQDGAFMGADIRSLNVWLSLSHCGDDAPGLDVVGHRIDHIVRTGDNESRPGGSGHANWGVSPQNAEQAAAGDVLRPIFEPGDALIFDQLLLHRTGHDPGMQKSRYAIETWLFAPSTYAAMTTPTESGYSPRDQLPIVL